MIFQQISIHSWTWLSVLLKTKCTYPLNVLNAMKVLAHFSFFHCLKNNQRTLNFIKGNKMRAITLRKHWTMVIMVRFLIYLKHSFKIFWFIHISQDYSSNTLNHCMTILMVRKFWFTSIFHKNFSLTEQNTIQSAHWRNN